MSLALTKKFIIAAAAASLLAGCSSSGERPGRSMIGAGLDALSGLTGRGRAERNAALIGSGTDAVSTAEADPYMAQQEAALRAAVESDGVKVARSGNQIIINVPSSTIFDASKQSVRRGAQPLLKEIGAVLKKFDRTTVDVYGHTDSDGNEKKNLQLTQGRALAVATYLAGQGVNEKRLSVTGFGGARPVGPNDTPDGRVKNRRIEIQLSPVS